jgi:hypothetical protein
VQVHHRPKLDLPKFPDDVKPAFAALDAGYRNKAGIALIELHILPPGQEMQRGFRQDAMERPHHSTRQNDIPE